MWALTLNKGRSCCPRWGSSGGREMSGDRQLIRRGAFCWQLSSSSYFWWDSHHPLREILSYHPKKYYCTTPEKYYCFTPRNTIAPPPRNTVAIFLPKGKSPPARPTPQFERVFSVWLPFYLGVWQIFGHSVAFPKEKVAQPHSYSSFDNGPSIWTNCSNWKTSP